MSEASFGQPGEPPSSITLFLSSQKDYFAFSKPFSFFGNEGAGGRGEGLATPYAQIPNPPYSYVFPE
jgi:hypothetical protein